MSIHLRVFVLIITLALPYNIIRGKTIQCPEPYCRCDNKGIAKCNGNGKHLRYIPALPKYVRILDFENNYLENVNRITFFNLTKLHLEEIYLAECKIKTISVDAFEDLVFLRVLDMSSNSAVNITQLSSAFTSLHITVQKLMLGSNGWSNLSKNMFFNLQKKNISHLSLLRNKLTMFNFDSLHRITSLKEVELSYNRLYMINGTHPLENIETLYIGVNNLNGKNALTVFSKQCIFPSLRILSMVKNGLLSFEQKFKCLTKLEKLWLDNNMVKKLPGNIFSHMSQLQSLSLKSIGVESISKFAFNISSLRKLYLSNNAMHFGSSTFSFSLNDFFKYCPKVYFLEMSSNSMSDILWSDLDKMFMPLQHTLETLILQSVHMIRLPPHFFQKFRNLKNLQLSHNGIKTWNGEAVFGNMSGLEYLSLDSNKISLIDQTSFPPTLLKNIKTLNLAGNPYSCKCDLLWFQNFLKEHSRTIQFTGYPISYTCNDPKRQLLKDYKIVCGLPLHPLVKVAIGLSTVVGTVILLMILVYKARWHLRYWIYLARKKKKGYRIITSEDTFDYDGYVIYSDEDRMWVHEEMLPVIEDEKGFKLCIRLRDFKVGNIYVDNIVENMEKSRKFVVILSRKFATCEWCTFEMMLAQTRLIEEGRELLILVMLEELDSNILTKAVHSLVTTTPHIQWSTSDTGRVLFYNDIVECLSSGIKEVKNYGSINT